MAYGSSSETFTAYSRITRVNPTSSSTVSPRARRPIRKPATSSGAASPRIIRCIACSDCSVLSVPPSAMVFRNACIKPTEYVEWSASGCEGGAYKSAHHQEPVVDYPRTFRGEDALRVKLNAVYRQRPVADTHHDFLRRLRSHDQLVRQGIPVDHEGMITGRREVLFDAAEEVVLLGVPNLARLAVHERRGVNDPASEHFSDGLMAKAHAQNWLIGSKLANYGFGDPRLSRPAGTR